MSNLPKTKLIFSRKGFDSSSGGGPSPMIDGKLYSLPIPQEGTGIRYDQLNQGNVNYGQLCRDLFGEDKGECHLDPDVYPDLFEDQPPNWHPAFGQTGASLSHLKKHRVGVGDEFLFFGWFREAEKKNGKWAFVPKAPDLHIIFAYMSVKEVWERSMGSPPNFLRNHPHLRREDMFHQKGNAIFISDKSHSFIFDYHPSRVLTSKGRTRSIWQLPYLFFDEQGYCRLSYHHKRKGEKMEDGDWYLMKAVPRGQEFVIEMDDYLTFWKNKLASI